MNMGTGIGRRLAMFSGAIAVAFAAMAWAQQPVTFGMRTTGDSYVLTTGAHTVFTIAKSGGDLTSMKFNGTEMEAPFDKAGRHSHYASGLSKDSVATVAGDQASGWVKVTFDDEKLGVTQYYIIHKGDDALYMATYAEKLPPPGEMRYVTYLDKAVFPGVPVPSNISLANAVVEGKDVFVNKENGQTHSKFFASTQFLDDHVHGATGKGIGAFMNTGNREHASGGPFFRDIEFQTTEGAIEMYNYMYSGHTQTEPFRPGLHGPYALQFTTGAKPESPDYSFIAKLGLKGYLAVNERGTLAGTAGPIEKDEALTVGVSSPAAEYWGKVDDAGRFAIADIAPGAYVETLYRGQLAVAKKDLTIAAGASAVGDITAVRVEPPAAFRIGVWDGTPNEFMNAEKISTMHPSDSRMVPFKDADFVVGKSKDSDWPIAQFRDVNNDLKITFDLTARQAATPMTLRIGITLAFQGGRPQVDVNAGQQSAWKSPLPEFSDQPKQSRGITRGTFRGNNFIHAFPIPASVLHAGTNTIDISIGAGGKGMTGFLSPSMTFDAIDLVPTAAIR